MSHSRSRRRGSSRRESGPRDSSTPLTELVTAEGFSLEVRPSIEADGTSHGWTDYLRQIVWVDASCDEAERIRILGHELAHIRCDHQNRDITRAQGECEADSVAFVVCQSLGLDISSSAVDYVATWASRDDAEVLEEALTAIHTAAASILAELEHDEQE